MIAATRELEPHRLLVRTVDELNRYDYLKSGRVKPIDGEDFFRKLRERSEQRRSR